jgi:hypothetical protein
MLSSFETRSCGALLRRKGEYEDPHAEEAAEPPSRSMARKGSEL